MAETGIKVQIVFLEHLCSGETPVLLFITAHGSVVRIRVVERKQRLAEGGPGAFLERETRYQGNCAEIGAVFVSKSQLAYRYAQEFGCRVNPE